MVKRDLVKQGILIVLLLLGLIGLRLYVFEPVTITSQMANQYLKENDFIIVAKQADIDYGDFVLYQVDEKSYVGRVIAMSNDRVTYMDDVLYRNDSIVEEKYLESAPHQEYYTQDLTISTITNGETDQVPTDSYFILNDNRMNLEDSRSFGLIASQQIIGRLTFRLSPLNEFGFIQTDLTQ